MLRIDMNSDLKEEQDVGKFLNMSNVVDMTEYT